MSSCFPKAETNYLLMDMHSRKEELPSIAEAAGSWRFTLLHIDSRDFFFYLKEIETNYMACN